MKNLLRTCAIASVVLVLASLAHAQEGSTRAEFECLTLANSSRVVAAGAPSPFVSFHHVWTPGIDYGTFVSNGLKLTYETQGRPSFYRLDLRGLENLGHYMDSLRAVRERSLHLRS